MDTKICICCNTEKPVSAFPTKRGKPNANCKVCWNAKNKLYRDSNKEKEAIRHSEHWARIKGTEKQKAVNKKKCHTYQINHLDVFRFSTAKYRASKLRATPVWADMEKIKSIYLNCPEGFHVDHIIPLQGEIVSGLHVDTNLQYLQASLNIQKSNKYFIL